jgi:hypothetical protein
MNPDPRELKNMSVAELKALLRATRPGVPVTFTTHTGGQQQKTKAHLIANLQGREYTHVPHMPTGPRWKSATVRKAIREGAPRESFLGRWGEALKMDERAARRRAARAHIPRIQENWVAHGEDPDGQRVLDSLRRQLGSIRTHKMNHLRETRPENYAELVRRKRALAHSSPSASAGDSNANNFYNNSNRAELAKCKAELAKCKAELAKCKAELRRLREKSRG